MAKTAMGISITTVSTDAQAPLGFIHIEPASVGNSFGETHYIYVKNIGGPLATGQVAKRASPLYEVDVSVADSDDVAVGVCVTPIPNNSYGFLIRKGAAPVIGGAGALGQTAATDAGGTCKQLITADFDVGATGIGNYLDADLVNLNCRG